jgi:hypothetical protein
MPEARTLDGRRAVAIPEALLVEVLLKRLPGFKGRREGTLGFYLSILKISYFFPICTLSIS